MAGHPEILPERLFDLFSLSTLLILGFKFFLRGNHFWRVNYFKLKGKLYPVGDRRWAWTQCRCFGVYFVIFGRLQHVHLLHFLVKSVDDLSTTPISELIPLQQGVSPRSYPPSRRKDSDIYASVCVPKHLYSFKDVPPAGCYKIRCYSRRGIWKNSKN